MVRLSTLVEEINTLPACCYSEVMDFIGYIKEKKAKETLSLEKAAEIAAEDYRTNKELTAFCALDGNAFYEAG